MCVSSWSISTLGCGHGNTTPDQSQDSKRCPRLKFALFARACAEQAQMLACVATWVAWWPLQEPELLGWLPSLLVSMHPFFKKRIICFSSYKVRERVSVSVALVRVRAPGGGSSAQPPEASAPGESMSLRHFAFGFGAAFGFFFACSMLGSAFGFGA